MVEVAGLAELEEGIPKTVKANGREIILVKWRDDVYALRNICPHQSASFSTGRTRPSVNVCRSTTEQPRPGPAGWDLEIDESNPIIRCPWHKWEFRLKDGYCATDPRFRVRAYPTTVQDGLVFVDTRA